jgi:hypothetical protein
MNHAGDLRSRLKGLLRFIRAFASGRSREPVQSLARAAMLQVAARISLIVLAASAITYLQAMYSQEAAVKEQLELFTNQRIQIENQWLDFVDRRLTHLREEYIERYRRELLRAEVGILSARISELYP